MTNDGSERGVRMTGPQKVMIWLSVERGGCLRFCGFRPRFLVPAEPLLPFYPCCRPSPFFIRGHRQFHAVIRCKVSTVPTDSAGFVGIVLFTRALFRNGVQESAIAIKRVTGRRFFDEKLDISSCLMLQLGVCLVQRTIQRWSCFFRRERSSKSLAVLEETSCYQTLSL